MTCYQLVNDSQIGIDFLFFKSNLENFADVFFITNELQDSNLRSYSENALFIYQQISNIKQHITYYQVVNHSQTSIKSILLLFNLGNHQGFFHLLIILDMKQNMICHQIANCLCTNSYLLFQIVGMKKNMYLH